MFHDRALTSATQADPRPRSAVSTGVGLAGLAGFARWVAIARHYGMVGPLSALVNLAFVGVPMVAWSLLVDKVHRNPSTGIDWALRRPLGETLDVSLVKLAGLWATWAAIAAIYITARWYGDGQYPFAIGVLATAAPALVALSIPYVVWLDRRLIEPRDGAWSFGAWLIGHDRAEDGPAIANHLRSWAVKGFFLAFMLSIVPGGFAEVVGADLAVIVRDPALLAGWLIALMFVIDVALATVGYALTMRPLDAHIRSANPYAAGWVAALICYPPFALMGPGGPLHYSVTNFGDQSWLHWFAGSPRWLTVWGAMLVALTAIYAWATVAFGLRFSNLTHRGILTHGPYAWTRHPAYWSKNAFWWVATLPFLTTTGSWIDAARNTAILAAVSGVYWWRARTEERHLGDDPAYADYAAWIERNGVIARLRRVLSR